VAQLEIVDAEDNTKSRHEDQPGYFLSSVGHMPHFPITVGFHTPSIVAVAYDTDGMQSNKTRIASAILKQ
jgi:hypothetical protein